MLVVCSIMLAVNAGGIPIVDRADVEGRLLKEDDSKYLVDFSEGVKKFDLVGKPEDYAKILVYKSDCIKE